MHPAKKKEPTENSVDPHCFSGDYNNITSKEKSQCKTSANFSSEFTSNILFAFQKFSDLFNKLWMPSI